MKYVPFVSTQQFNAREILQAVCESAPKGAALEEQRRRCRILNALQALEERADGVVLEDADHQALKRIVSEFLFSKAHPELLALIEAVIDAKEPATPGKRNGAAAETQEANGVGAERPLQARLDVDRASEQNPGAPV